VSEESEEFFQFFLSPFIDAQLAPDSSIQFDREVVTVQRKGGLESMRLR